jgi:hypothetical protein
MDNVLGSCDLEGRSDYRTGLFVHAMELLKARSMFLKDGVLSEEVRAPLVKSKLIVRSGDRDVFRHELIRAYLASQYIKENLTSFTSGTDFVPDASWRSTLEFVLTSVDSSKEINRLLVFVLKSDEGLAKLLFKYACDSVPSYSKEEQRHFVTEYGRTTLGVSEHEA